MGNKLLSIKLSLLAKIFAAGFAFLLVYFAISMAMIYKTALGNERDTAHFANTIRISGEIGNASDYLTLQAQKYSITGDKTYLDNYWREVNETKSRDNALKQLIDIGIPKEILALADNAKNASDTLIQTEEAAFAEVAKGNLKKAGELMFGRAYDDGKSIIVGYLDDFVKQSSLYSETVVKKSRSKLNFLILQCTIIISVLAVAFCVFISLFLIHLLSAMRKLQKMFEQIADGDMRVHAPIVNGESEICSLYQSMNVFISNIGAILRNVISSSEEVATGNNQLSKTMEELSCTFNEQSNQVKDNANNMDTLLETTRSTVSHLNNNTSIIGETVARATDGRNQLTNLLKGMENIHSQTNSLSETINKLAESSAEIGDIVTVISDIADQTNLLALNAAIEAARAGEAGRGFAVVADEVRKLAERTTKATSEVKSIISSLQKGSELAFTEMQNATSKVKEGVDNIGKTETVFNDIFSGIDIVKSNTTSISRDIEDEYRIIEQVSNNTRAVSAGIDESNSAVSDVLGTVSHHQEQINNLKKMVSRFKV